MPKILRGIIPSGVRESIDGDTQHDARQIARILLEISQLRIDVWPVLNAVFVEEQTMHCISNYSN